MSRLWSWARFAVRAALLLAAAVLVVAALLPLAPSDAWWVRYPAFPALQLAAAAVPVGALLLVLWRHRIAWGAVVCLLVAVAVQAGRLAPYVAPLVGATVDDGTCAPENRVRLLEANVQRTNRHDHALLEMIQKLDPDIAWFQEVNGWWEDELSALDRAMPHSVHDVQPNYFGVHLFSRLPLAETSIQQLTGSNNPSVFATATLPSGRRLRVYAIHPRPPQIGQSTAERDAQLMATALAARGDTVAHLVVGDLNAVPWDDALHRLERIGRLADPRVGRGLFITWNAKRTLAKWPLDHILPGPGVSLVSLQVLAPFGSDHHPLLAELCVTGGGGTAEPLPADVLAAARATVAAGQGKAFGPGSVRPEGAETNEKED